MRLRRARREPETTAAPAPEAPSIADFSDKELHAEAKRRGWQMLPVGAFERTVGDLTADRDAAVNRATEAAAQLAAKLGTAFKVIDDALVAARDAEVRAQRADHEVTALAGALVASEFPEHTDHD